jgi:hypothetical protein
MNMRFMMVTVIDLIHSYPVFPGFFSCSPTTNNAPGILLLQYERPAKDDDAPFTDSGVV